MNQILITEKLYITPELKRKKLIYKFNFIGSIVLILILFSFYAYASYDRNKSADISQDILENMKVSSTENDDTTIATDDDVWVIVLDNSNEDQINSGVGEITTTQEEKDSSSNSSSSNKTTNTQTVGTYKASNGKVYNTVGTINIPSINVNYPILSETTDALLKISVCKFWGCSPNEIGNLCIAGHNYRNSRFFSKVLNLGVGDIIEITDIGGRTLSYSVYDKYTVDPSDVSCTSQLTNNQKIVTLITCTNDSQQRVVVKAKAN